MTREKFIRLSGWVLILGSFLILFGWLAGSRPEYNPYNLRSLPVDRYANLATLPLISTGMALISLGMLGLLVRYGREAGNFGQFSLGFGAVAGLVSTVGVIGLEVYDSEPWWSIFFMGWTFQSLFLALFGVVSLQRRLLPRWNGLPILAGIGLPVYVLISQFYELATGSGLNLPEALSVVLILALLVGLSGLGYMLQSQVRPDTLS